jgi:hypothetical protein
MASGWRRSFSTRVSGFLLPLLQVLSFPVAGLSSHVDSLVPVLCVLSFHSLDFWSHFDSHFLRAILDVFSLYSQEWTEQRSRSRNISFFSFVPVRILRNIFVVAFDSRCRSLTLVVP